MLIVGSRLTVSDNSGAKEVQCIKVKGQYASIGDIITCSIKKAGKGKVEQACDDFRCANLMKAIILLPLHFNSLTNRSPSSINLNTTAGPGRESSHCRDQKRGAATGRQRH